MQRFSAVTIVVAVLVGVVVGLGAYTFVYAKGYSYLTNNPAACANCHIMQAQYEAWMKSSHHAVA
jgi:cytochrome c nitrite reductase small subunit